MEIWTYSVHHYSGNPTVSLMTIASKNPSCIHILMRLVKSIQILIDFSFPKQPWTPHPFLVLENISMRRNPQWNFDLFWILAKLMNDLRVQSYIVLTWFEKLGCNWKLSVDARLTARRRLDVTELNDIARNSWIETKWLWFPIHFLHWHKDEKAMLKGKG